MQCAIFFTPFIGKYLFYLYTFTTQFSYLEGVLIICLNRNHICALFALLSTRCCFSALDLQLLFLGCAGTYGDSVEKIKIRNY